MSSFREQQAQAQSTPPNISKPISGSLQLRSDITTEALQKYQEDFLPGYMGLQIVGSEFGCLEAQMEIQPFMLAPNGYLHAATIIALADTACGYGTFLHLPSGAKSFTTIELKSNFLSTAQSGMLHCVATAAHGGRNTQVWDAVVTGPGPDGRTLALFRCTQMILYPK